MRRLLAALVIIPLIALGASFAAPAKVEARATCNGGIIFKQSLPHSYRLSCSSGSGYVQVFILCKPLVKYWWMSSARVYSSTIYKPPGVTVVVSVRCSATYPLFLDSWYESWGS